MGRQSLNLAFQLQTFVSTRLRETSGRLSIDGHAAILEESGANLGIGPDFGEELADHLQLDKTYVQAIAADLEAVGIQLQAKNPDFWDSYDRQMAEAQFRYGIVPPLILIILLLASDSVWWLLLLAAPILLLYRGVQHSYRAASTLVQAIVLKMVEPPILERLQEVVVKKREEEEANKPRTARIRQAKIAP